MLCNRQHFAVTWEQIESRFTFYRNGVKIGEHGDFPHITNVFILSSLTFSPTSPAQFFLFLVFCFVLFQHLFIGVIFFSATKPGGSQQPIVPGGVIHAGHDADIFNGDFDEKQAFDGIIDEFRIWNYARSPSQIAANWQKSVEIANSDLNIYWK